MNRVKNYLWIVHSGLRALYFTVVVMGCTDALCGQQQWENESGMVENRVSAEHTLMQKNSAIMALPGVLGTGLSLCGGNSCIKVFVRYNSPELKRELKRIIGNCRFIIEESDSIHTLPEED